jgi:8-amino-7-oxononanoate synthase
MDFKKDTLKNYSLEEKRELLKKLILKKGTAGKALEKKEHRIVGSFPDSPQFIEFQKNKELLHSWNANGIYFNPTDGISNNLINMHGREMINYSCYNYLGMSGDPNVSSAAKEAIEKYGTSVSASRIASGEKPLHRQLEKALSEFLGTEDCIVLVGGYSTNETVIGHIANSNDLIVYDSFIHESVRRGSQLSGAAIRAFPHNKCQALDTILSDIRKDYEKALIIIEGVYSMDGDIPDLPEIVKIKKRHQAMLMVDEAHSIGVLGNTGRGIGEYCNIDRKDVEFWMGTLSKSFGSCGGYIAAQKEIVEYLKYTTPGFVYSAGMSPPDAAAALAAVTLASMEPQRTRKLQENSRLFLEAARGKGWNTGASKDSGVIPLILGNSAKCIQLYHLLFERGIFSIPVLYPAVPENAARLRFFINSTHTRKQIEMTILAIEESLSNMD